jgi:hypothetical protein
MTELKQLPILKKLPMDIVNIIIKFYGTIKLRNGKYMLQIDTNNEKYSLIRNNFQNKIHTIPTQILDQSSIFYTIFFVTLNNDNMCLSVPPDNAGLSCMQALPKLGEIKHLYWAELTGDETIHFLLTRSYIFENSQDLKKNRIYRHIIPYSFIFTKENMRMALYKKIYPSITIDSIFSFRKKATDIIKYEYKYN